MLYALQPPGPRSYYPFRFFDDVTKKWARARYVAELHVIAERYEKWKIIGPPEIRSGTPIVMFSPWASLPPRTAAHLPPVEEAPPDHGPAPDPPIETATAHCEAQSSYAANRQSESVIC
jgi:hypothetical protein